MNACTVTTQSRLAYAIVLARSFLSIHPRSSFFILVLDGVGVSERDEQSRSYFLTPADVGIPHSELSIWAMVFDATRVVEAAAPRVLSNLVKKTGQPAVYFADDTRVFSGLEHLRDLAEDHGLVLNRRTGSPFPADERTPNGQLLLNDGTFDPGFMAVGEQGLDFLNWLICQIDSELVSREEDGHAQGGQRLDLASSWFPHHELTEPGAGVSFWNVADRILHWRDGGIWIGEAPLRYFRFESYDPDQPHLLGVAQGPKPRVLLSRRPDLKRLTTEYREELLTNGFAAAEKAGRFDRLPGGLPIDDRMRRIFRKAVRKARLGEEPPPPDPFDPHTSQEFMDWLKRPDPASRSTILSRYLYSIYDDRHDLRITFPGIAGADGHRFLEWVTTYGAREESIPHEIVEEAAAHIKGPGSSESTNDGSAAQRAAAAADARPRGLNLVGYFTSELGIGEAARLILEGVRRSGIPYSTFSYDANLSRQNHAFREEGTPFSFDTNLICINADQLHACAWELGQELLGDRYNIGLWWWEVDPLPSKWASAAAFVDETWVGSTHVGSLVAAATDKPVHVIPVPLRQVQAPPLSRAQLGLPEGFMFLFTFDFFSAMERKNPIAVIDAFKLAFRPGQGPVLVIKGINGNHFPVDFERLHIAAEGREDILLLDRYLSSKEQDALIGACDCYVSLHRAEGLGLGMAEAMSLGKPVIATGYSGNLTFMNESNSFLVSYKMATIPATQTLYPIGGVWADPAVDEAAEFMQRVYLDPDAARDRGTKARRDIATVHTFERTAEFVLNRMSQIWKPSPLTESHGSMPLGSPARLLRRTLRRRH